MIQKLKNIRYSKLSDSKVKCSKMSKALKVSLIINIIFISIIIGKAIFMFNYNHGSFAHKPPLNRSIMQEHRINIQSHKKVLIKALLEQPYNKQKVTLAFTNFNNATDKARLQLNNAIIEKAAILEPKQRLKLLPRHLKRNFKYKDHYKFFKHKD